MSKSRKSDHEFEGEIYSIRNLMEKMEKDLHFCDDKIFQILNQKSPDERFKYVHFKIKKIKERENKSRFFGVNENGEGAAFKTLIQIIDMSDKMLYNEVKA
jgi:methyl coenzyme M reductase gamma subunit